MKRFFLMSQIIVLFILAFSCQEGETSFDVDCAQCESVEPDSFNLSVDLTINNLYDTVYLEFYKGRVESGTPSWEGEVTTPLFFHLVPVGEYYSVKATYKNDGKTIIAIDGDKMVSRYIIDACDNDCWIVRGNLLNVELKY